ncbi:MAG: PAS domain S-box protein [Nostocaceae cyanobacterium]|nr:PAS domain S-box protein [Nostocaceae cyanobacterium]
MSHENLQGDFIQRRYLYTVRKKSEESLTMMADTAPVMIWMAGCDIVCNYFNAVWLEFTGCSLSQAIGNGWLDRVHPEDRQICQDISLNAVNKPQKFQRQYRLLNANGKYHWILDTAAPQFDVDGNFIGYTGCCIDINHIKEETTELKNRTPTSMVKIRGNFNGGEKTLAVFAENQALDTEEVNSTKSALLKSRNIESPISSLIVGIVDEIYQGKVPNTEIQKNISIIDTISDLIAIADLNGKLLFINHSARNLLGIANKNKLTIQTLSDLLNPEYLQEFSQEILPTTLEKGHWQGELKLKNFFTGKEIPVEYNLFAIENPQTGEPILVTIACNLSDSKTAEETAWQNEAQYRHLIRTTAERTKAILNILTAKATAELQRQRTEEALRQSEKQFRELAAKETLINALSSQIRASLDINTILETAVQEIRKLLQINRCYFVWYRKKSDLPYWEVVNEANNQKVPSMVGMHITNAQIGSLAQKILKKEIICIDDIQNMPDSVWQDLGFTALLSLPIHTQSGEIGALGCGHSTGSRIWHNSEVELLLAVADQLAIAIDQGELYKQSRIAAQIAQEKAQQLEETLRELQATQTQLIQSEKMSSLGQLVAGIAHEINNPVNFIHGNINHASHYIEDLLNLVELYQQHYPNPVEDIEEEIEAIDLEFLSQDLPKLLSSMKIGTSRIRQIVLSLRNFSRLDQADMKAVDIHEGIDSTLLLLQNRLKPKSGQVEIQVVKEYGNLPLVQCYAGQLNQVFMNLLANAIDALEEEIENIESSVQKAEVVAVENINFPTFKISIRTEVKDDFALIRIADNGSGMTEQVRQHLFDPFFTTKAVGKGTGMGLSISYKIIVEKHRGQLECISAPGKGAEFVIFIPLQQP